MDLGFLDEMDAGMRGEVLEYLEGRRRVFSGEVVREALERSGTVFERAVLRVMAGISYGEVRTYGEVAAVVQPPHHLFSLRGQSDNTHTVLR